MIFWTREVMNIVKAYWSFSVNQVTWDIFSSRKNKNELRALKLSNPNIVEGSRICWDGEMLREKCATNKDGHCFHWVCVSFPVRALNLNNPGFCDGWWKPELGGTSKECNKLKILYKVKAAQEEKKIKKSLGKHKWDMKGNYRGRPTSRLFVSLCDPGEDSCQAGLSDTVVAQQHHPVNTVRLTLRVLVWVRAPLGSVVEGRVSGVVGRWVPQRKVAARRSEALRAGLVAGGESEVSRPG